MSITNPQELVDNFDDIRKKSCPEIGPFESDELNMRVLFAAVKTRNKEVFDMTFSCLKGRKFDSYGKFLSELKDSLDNLESPER